MKQVTYTIRGMVIEAMIPAISASCRSLFNVVDVRMSISATDADAEKATLTLTLEEAPSDALEEDLRRIMTAKGLDLILPATSVTDTGSPSDASASPEETSPSEALPSDTSPAPEPVEGAKHYVAAPPAKPGKTVSLTGAVGTVITAVILAVLLTFSLVTSYMKKNVPTPPPEDTAENPMLDDLSLIDRLFRSATMFELDDDELVTGVLKGYVAATGDRHAAYLTAEELSDRQSDYNGEMCGVGLSIVKSSMIIDGAEQEVATVFNVFPDSPAEKAGVLPGDAIVAVGKGDDRVDIKDVGYTRLLDRMTGKEGTECNFTVYRVSTDGTSAEYVDISAVRKKLTTRSVVYKQYALDPKVGIVRITEFDNTTKNQFVESVEALKKQGCEYFILDLRNNLGGLLTSVQDLLVFFLEEGDLAITTENNRGVKTETKIAVNEDGFVTCGTRTLKKEDIGKYRDLRMAVLVNEYTASAAELFAANIRDYELGMLVGTKTFGKGSVQTTYTLENYGLDGALKLTVAYYYPPSGEGYDGIGITPHEGYAVDLSAEAQKISIHILPHEKDDQLKKAVEAALADTPN